MATVKVYNQKKEEIGEITLIPEIFEIEPRPEILNFVTRAQMAAKRAGTHNAKTRAQVSGGGVKPWKQKGTGRARAGSNRSPVWRGGAIVFGPSPRSYAFKVNRKVRSLALKMALSSRLSSEAIMIVDKIEIEQAKTKLFAMVAKDLDLHNALVVLPQKDEILFRAANNISDIDIITEDKLNVYGILKRKQLVLLRDSISLIESRFAVKGE